MSSPLPGNASMGYSIGSLIRARLYLGGGTLPPANLTGKRLIEELSFPAGPRRLWFAVLSPTSGTRRQRRQGRTNIPGAMLRRYSTKIFFWKFDKYETETADGET